MSVAINQVCMMAHAWSYLCFLTETFGFVLCPGGEYDRSPCGTVPGQARVLAGAGKLAPGDVWRQKSIVGSVFEASYQNAADGIVPTIRGRTHVTSRPTCVISEDDPFRFGISVVS